MALKLNFSPNFCRGKISQKIRMKRKWDLDQNLLKFYTIFIFLDAKYCKYFFIFSKFRLFWTKCSIYFWNLAEKTFPNSERQKVNLCNCLWLHLKFIILHGKCFSIYPEMQTNRYYFNFIKNKATYKPLLCIKCIKTWIYIIWKAKIYVCLYCFSSFK